MAQNSNMIKFAIGTDDNVNYSSEHFGSARFFQIYSLNLETKEIILLETIDNETPEEEHHGDPEKAKSVSGLLKDVSIFVGKRMGPNITRIRKKYVPIISRTDSIERSLSLLPKLIPDIKKESEKPMGTSKEVLMLVP